MTKNISKLPRTNRGNYYSKLIHSDICGPISPMTNTKKRYIISYIDDYSKYTEIYLLRKRDAETVLQTTKSFITRLNNQIRPSTIKRFHSDGAKEYISLSKTLFDELGINYTYSAPYTLEQNSVAERFNRTLLNRVRALLVEATLPKKYWGEAAIVATYLYNRTPNSSINYKTPYEMRYNKQPDISHVRTWGSLAYKRIDSNLITKLDPRANRYYIIGYIEPNIYKLLDPTTSKTTIARDLVIFEQQFYKSNSSPNSPISKVSNKG